MSLLSTPLMEFANSTLIPLAGLKQLTIAQDNATGAGQRSSSYKAAKKKLQLQNSLPPPPPPPRQQVATRRLGDDDAATVTAAAVLRPPRLKRLPPRSKRLPRRSRWESRPSNEIFLKKDKPTLVGSPEPPKRQGTIELDEPLPKLPNSPPTQPQRQLTPPDILNGRQETYKLRQHTVFAQTA